MWSSTATPRRSSISSRSSSVAAVTLLALPGCLAFPVASPPLHSHLTFGTAGGELLDSADVTRPGDAAPWARLRLGVNPMQLLQSERGRLVDFGVGYSWQGAMDAAHRRPGVHGLYGYVAYHPVDLPLGDDWAFRVLVHSALEIAFHDGLSRLDVGGGGTAGATLELVSWTHGEVQDEDGEPNFIGVAVGEGGVGLTFEAGYHVVGPQAFWSITGGLNFRLPGAAGVAILWL